MPTGRWSRLLVGLLLLGFGVTFGLNYGLSNHAFYLLPSLSWLHPELWSGDWLLRQTHHYHALFAALASALLWLDPSGWLLGLGNVLAIAAGMACVFAVLRQLLAPTPALCALLMVLAIVTGTRTGTAGTSYVFSNVFQPSTLGALGVLAASWLLAVGRPLASGLALLGGGLFHTNYLLLCGPVFWLAQLAQGREGIWARWLKQLGPPLLALPAFVPMIVATSSSPVVAEAQRIYQDVRSPHHYRVDVFARDLVPSLGWAVLGVSVSWKQLQERPVYRRLLGLLGGFGLLIAPSLLVSWLLTLRPLMQLYPWRLLPNAEIWLQALFCACMVERITAPRSVRRLRGERVIVLACLALIAYGGVVGRQLLPFAVASAGYLLAELCLAGPGALATERLGKLLPQLLLLTLLVANLPRCMRLAQESTLLGRRDEGLSELCDWLQTHTSAKSILLTPPDNEYVRFQCQRAIVVDWKSAPMVPEEVLAWQKRMQDVTGRRPLRSSADMAGYAELTPQRLATLRASYGFDYVVADSSRQPALDLAPAFVGRQFVVYALPAAKASAAAPSSSLQH